MRKKPSKILEAVHDTAKGLYVAGAIDQVTMREFDHLSLTPAPPLPPLPPLRPSQIKRIRDFLIESYHKYSHNLMELPMYLGGILGTILLVVLIIYIARRM